MNQNYMYRLVLIPQLGLMILNILFIFIFLIPFFAQSIHTILGGHLYYYIENLILGVSVLLGSIITIIVFQKRYRMKKMINIGSVQFLVLLCFFITYYFNMHELNELMNRPTYE